MSSASVVVERRGAASVARVARPERGNAYGTEVVDRLERWIAEAATEPGVRALVLTGTGPAFCAGADMREGAALLGDPDAVLAFIARGRALCDRLAAAPLPVVAAVNGVAFAGGFEVVLAADLAIAVRDARLGDCHLRAGVLPGWGSSARLPAIVGPRRAARVLLTGATFSAEEMRAMGVLDEVVEPAELDDAVDAIVRSLASVEETAGQAMLQLVRAARRPDGAAFDREWQALEAHVRGPVFADAVRRFGR